MKNERKNTIVKQSGQPQAAKPHGFTLIELLIVVLIIGILAAVALPQYQLAVAKSRYATLKNLAHSIEKAEEVYYLANGAYTNSFGKLDISMPSGKLGTSTSNQYDYDWGMCHIQIQAYVRCNNAQIGMGYQIVFKNASVSNAGQKICLAHNSDLNSTQAKVCKQETKHSAFADGSNWGWRY